MAKATKSENLSVRKPVLTQERLREMLHYDPETGDFTWIVQKARCTAPGSLAGHLHFDRRRSPSRKYRAIKIDDRRYMAHTIAWFYMYGEMPTEIDHKDGNGLNNKIDNLRPCSSSQNCFNRGVRSDSITGLKGVGAQRGGRNYIATISVKGRKYYLGSFKTASDAHNAYVKASQQLHGEFARAK